MAKLLAIILSGIIVTACSGPISPPHVKFGKKCTVAQNRQMVYSYVWFHKKGEKLEATEENCAFLPEGK